MVAHRRDGRWSTRVVTVRHPSDDPLTCASRHVVSLGDTDLITLAAGDDTIRQQLAADCAAS